MRKVLTIALMAMIAVSASAAKKKAPAKDANKPVFTIIKENPITSVKDQNRSGTCWDYSTLSFFEAEILKATGKTYDLCESFVANKTYLERAIQVVRYHGDCQFAQGGSSEDVLQTLKTHGICPEEAMPFPGSLYGAMQRKSATHGRLVCRASSTLTSESVLRSSPTKARSTHRRVLLPALASTSTTT